MTRQRSSLFSSLTSKRELSTSLMSVKILFRRAVFGKKRCRSILENDTPYQAFLPPLLFNLRLVVTWTTWNAHKNSVIHKRTRTYPFHIDNYVIINVEGIC
ncbi:hypothetical protein COOONC_04094 [Cooperia oncophora]